MGGMVVGGGGHTCLRTSVGGAAISIVVKMWAGILRERDRDYDELLEVESRVFT
jgi:hypothetical protein